MVLKLYGKKACKASSYPFKPKPIIIPLALGAIKDSCLNFSRACTLDICTSITGVSMALMASPIPTEVCV